MPTSTVRYYERIGLLSAPDRTGSGYRSYDEQSANRLLFVTRARRLGLSCDQITELLPVWDGANCGAAAERVANLIDSKQAEVAARIAELKDFSAQLDDVRTMIASSQPPDTCSPDLSCCVPARSSDLIPIEMSTRPLERKSATSSV